MPVELLGPVCGGNNGRCGAQCEDTREQRSSSCTPSSYSPNRTTKTIKLPNPSGLTFPSYLKSLEMSLEGKDNRVPPSPRPPHVWKKRYQIALWKGVVCGFTYFQIEFFLRWYFN